MAEQKAATSRLGPVGRAVQFFKRLRESKSERLARERTEQPDPLLRLDNLSKEELKKAKKNNWINRGILQRVVISGKGAKSKRIRRLQSEEERLTDAEIQEIQKKEGTSYQTSCQTTRNMFEDYIAGRVTLTQFWKNLKKVAETFTEKQQTELQQGTLSNEEFEKAKAQMIEETRNAFLPAVFGSFLEDPQSRQLIKKTFDKIKNDFKKEFPSGVDGLNENSPREDQEICGALDPKKGMFFEMLHLKLFG